MAARSIDDYYDAFDTGDFIAQGDGVYTLTISANVHGMGTGYRVSKVVKIGSDGVQYPVLFDYVIAANGDFVITTNERFNGRYYLSAGG